MYSNTYNRLKNEDSKRSSYSEHDDHKGYTVYEDKHTKREYRKEDRGGYTESSGPTSCYYDEFGNS